MLLNPVSQQSPVRLAFSLLPAEGTVSFTLLLRAYRLSLAYRKPVPFAAALRISGRTEGPDMLPLEQG